MRISVKTEGLGDALLRSRGVADGLKARIQEIMDEAAHLAEAEMLARVPRSGKTDRPTIAGSIRVETSNYSPGGKGGGGFHFARVGTDPHSVPTHLRYVYLGTGVYGTAGGRIAASDGGPMPMDFSAKTNFRMWARGQRSQTEWVTASHAVAREHIATELGRLGL